MEKITIYKNKGETFECQFKVDGCSIDETVIRLCLEFDNNKNMYFNGRIEPDGNCSIDIPMLKEVGSQNGRMLIEAIADATYFLLYEADVELKNSVEVTFVRKPTVESKKPKTSIKLDQISSTTPKFVPKKKVQVPEPVVEESIEEEIKEPLPQPEPAEEVVVSNPYIAKSSPKIEHIEPEKKAFGKLSKFEEYLKRKN